jgi:hypothetical protein
MELKGLQFPRAGTLETAGAFLLKAGARLWLHALRRRRPEKQRPRLLVEAEVLSTG